MTRITRMSASTRSRKRTKTFTGCWTCRARKIKCDEARPSCRQCCEKNLSCEGYSARLQWLKPATGEQGLHSQILPEGSLNQSLRRLLPAEPLASTLDWDQVDSILRYLDSLELVINSNSEEVSANIQNFGVFSVSQGISPTPGDGINAPSPYIPKTFQPESGYELIFDPDSVLLDSELSHGTSEAEAAWNLCNLHEEQLPLGLSNQQELATSGIMVPLAVNSNSGDLSENAACAHNLELGPLMFQGDTLSSFANKNEQGFPPLTNPLENLEISPQERLLMNHYRNRVVNLFCVIDNAKSPWKTIHLPRVLQCAGELSFGGATTRIRDALRKSLLSISAFYLSNNHQAHNRKSEAESWGTVASRYRCDAIGLLKYAVETDLYADKRPKYKEFLATMLSMVTINVMSGDTSTCGVHLDGAERVISQMNARKSKFSRKAQSLHRIYLYLRVIYESTAIRRPTSGVSRFSPSLDSQKTFGPQPAVPQQFPLIQDDNTSSSMMPITAEAMTSQGPVSELSSYECIYGIPQSLLILLKESIELIDELDCRRMAAQTLSVPESLNQACDELEQKIMDWPLDDRLRFSEFKDGISATIIYHQTRAFLNALIIFFSQGVRLMSHRYLRQYVQTILDSIEAIEQLKAETKILAAPLFWPAFMGATEAFEPRHQERFRQWYERVEVYGFEAVRTGIQVVHEVWRMGPTTHRGIYSGWRSVVDARNDISPYVNIHNFQNLALPISELGC
ncbi:fungal-specific transcription factor domain-containing protein [Aspergillus ambiguus]|uniref:Zn(II)2Cys6 transcription factor n=1 Tax=Aspergillus ambiguus TaxID=176160 RepID=UPI003CCD69C5